MHVPNLHVRIYVHTYVRMCLESHSPYMHICMYTHVCLQTSVTIHPSCCQRERKADKKKQKKRKETDLPLDIMKMQQ